MPLSTAATADSTRSRGKGRPRTSETAAPSLVEILNLIRSERATTRQALERESELGRAVVADRLQLLSDLGLVDESELGHATGGRAPRLVQFSARRGLVLVATLDQTAIGVGVSDLSGNLLTEHHEAADLTAPAAQLAGRLTALFNWCLERQPTPPAPWGISLSVPGTVPAGRDDAFLTATPPRPARMGGFSAGRNPDPPIWRASLDPLQRRNHGHGRIARRRGARPALHAVCKGRAPDRGGDCL